jgi:hypothetical protein
VGLVAEVVAVLAGTATRSVPQTLQPLLQLLLAQQALVERLV